MGVTQPLPPEIGPKSGLLSDGQIRRALERGYLFRADTFIASNAKYCSYEIRVGDTYELLRFRDGGVTHTPSETEEDRPEILIEPGETVLVTAQEWFEVPTDVFAKITVVGQLFSSGLAAENTFADPGYSGPLYVTLNNISTRTLSLAPGNPLARVEFHRLEEPVKEPHAGYSGRRPSFVKARIDAGLKEVLVNKSIQEIVSEMIERSVDDALYKRFSRSEILLQKAVDEIGVLQGLQKGLRRLRILTSLALGLIVFGLLREFVPWGYLNFQTLSSIVLSFFVSFGASLSFYFCQKKYLDA